MTRMDGVSQSHLVGLIGDVHGNPSALSSVLTRLDELGVASVRALGDWVGYNMGAGQVLRQLRSSPIVSVAGNHDLMLVGMFDGAASPLARRTLDKTRTLVGREDLDLLASLPTSIEEDWPAGRALLVHGTPASPIAGYLRKADIPDAVLPPGVAIVVTGATHRPLLTTRDGIIVLNPGSVGLPRDGDPRAAFAVVDRNSGRADIHRVLYDPTAVAHLNHRSGIPPTVNDYLFLGRASPSSLRIDLVEQETLDQTAAELHQAGRSVVRTGAGICFETAGGHGAVTVTVSVDGRVMLRSSSVPVDPESSPVVDGGAGHPLRLCEIGDDVFFELISESPVDEITARQLTEWCWAAEDAFASAAKKG